MAPLLNALKEKGGPVTVDAVRSILPAAKFVKSEERQPTLHKDAKRWVATYGPYVLVGKNVSSGTLPHDVHCSRLTFVAGTAAQIYDFLVGSERTSVLGRDL